MGSFEFDAELHLNKLAVKTIASLMFGTIIMVCIRNVPTTK